MDEQQHKSYTKLVIVFMLAGAALATYFAWSHYSLPFVIAVALVAHTWPLVFTRRTESHVLALLQWTPHAFALYSGKSLPIILLLILVIPVGAQLGMLVLCAFSEINHRRKQSAA